MDKDHGCLEIRRYWIADGLCTLLKTERWKVLDSPGMVERECRQGEARVNHAQILFGRLTFPCNGLWFYMILLNTGYLR
ncbi:MAG: hypothetical protein M8364_11405 [Methylobacter sp.]|uniref:hypothetical protein n=1 Tax=Methylobacter sp. TaxID=2051955 RepID=UPI0025851568|nr:hypothetical protein [Methylobacter sp.]MCL7421499.1 hypothetical protein [Methylobacter sp.]